jgi:hypothetical protein
MEIGDRQQFGLTRRELLRSRRALTFWTMTITAELWAMRVKSQSSQRSA